MSNIRYPMIISCIVTNPAKAEASFTRLLHEIGYIKISERVFVHEGGEQLTATLNFGKVFIPEISEARDCLTLYLSDAEHPINLDLCNDLNKILSAKAFDDF